MSAKGCLDRMQKEKDQLDNRITKLERFTSTGAHEGLTDYGVSLVMDQLQAMRSYSEILGRRITNNRNRFKKKGLRL